MAPRLKSLTMDSNAIAATTPGWRSSAPRFRVPNRITKVAMHTATQKPVSANSPPPASSGTGASRPAAPSASKLAATALSCKAI